MVETGRNGGGPLTVLCVSAARDLGGAEVVLLDTIAALRARDVGIRVLNLAPSPGGLVDTLKSRGAEVLFCPINRFRDPCSALRVLRWFISRVGEFRVALANDSRALLYTAVACTLLRRPYVWHVHDHLTGSSPFQRLAPWFGSTRCIAVSEAARRALEGYGCPGSRISVIPNAVDVAQFHPGVSGAAFRREVGIAPGAYVIGAVGRILPSKSLETVLEAAAHLQGSLPSAVFVVVGDVVTDEAHRLDALRYRDALLALRDRLGLGERVLFVGARQDMPRVMAALDVLAHPSLEESFGRVLIEAMASGKPVVATGVGGVPEIVEDGVTGYLVGPRDSQTLARRIETLAEPRARMPMGEAARARSVAHFSLSRFGEEMYSVVTRTARRER